MIKIKLTKIIANTLVIVSVLALNPIGASAEWKQDSNGWWYSEGSNWITGEKKIDGNYYYFDKNGYMNTGWTKVGSTWFYYNDHGYMKTGWIQDGDKWYYLNPRGYMATNTGVDGWYLNSDGVGTECIKSGGFEIDKTTGTIIKYSGNDTSLVIPREINGIEIKCIKSGSFLGCGKLQSITIPDSVTKIESLYSYKLTSIIVDDNNQNYTSIDGVLFDRFKSKLIEYPYQKEDTSYIIPSGVTDLDTEAFEYCYKLTSISVPDSVKYIGFHTFEKCTNAVFYVKSEIIKQLLIKNGITTDRIKLIPQV